MLMHSTARCFTSLWKWRATFTYGKSGSIVAYCNVDHRTARWRWQHCHLLQCGSQNSPVKVAALSRTAMWITEQPSEVHSKQTVRLWQLTVRCSTLCQCTNVNSITFYHQQHRHISVCYTINHAVNMLNKTASHKPKMVSRPLSALTQPVTQIHKQLNTETFFWQYKQNRCNLKNWCANSFIEYTAVVIYVVNSTCVTMNVKKKTAKSSQTTAANDNTRLYDWTTLRFSPNNWKIKSHILANTLPDVSSLHICTSVQCQLLSK